VELRFWGWKKETSLKKAGDEIPRMRTHQFQSTLLLFLQIAKILPG